MEETNILKAVKCKVKSIKTVYDRNFKTKKVWSYMIVLKPVDETYEYTMRIPPKQYKQLSIKKGNIVKAIEHGNSVCGIFDASGIGFMFTNIPFDMED